MKLILVATLLFFTACETKIEVQTAEGIKVLTVKTKSLVSTQIEKEQSLETLVVNETDSCDHPGVCCKCGLTFEFEHECSCSFWRNCPGTQSVKRQIEKFSFKKVYQIKTDKGELQKLYSPTYIGKNSTDLERGSCN